MFRKKEKPILEYTMEEICIKVLHTKDFTYIPTKVVYYEDRIDFCIDRIEEETGELVPFAVTALRSEERYQPLDIDGVTLHWDTQDLFFRVMKLPEGEPTALVPQVLLYPNEVMTIERCFAEEQFSRQALSYGILQGERYTWYYPDGSASPLVFEHPQLFNAFSGIEDHPLNVDVMTIANYLTNYTHGYVRAQGMDWDNILQHYSKNIQNDRKRAHMVRACVFDLDGTLLNTLTTIAYYGNESLKAFGLPPISQERYRYLIGNGAKVLVERMLREVGADESLFEAVYEKYTAAYEQKPLYLTVPYEGIVELLRELKTSGILTAVLSNKPHAPTCSVVDALFAPQTFERCYGQREGVPIKPDPTALHGVLEELGVAAEECLYIGDTAVDMKTGRAAGVRTVGVLWGFRDREELVENGADILLEHPMQLLDFLA